MMTSTSGSQRPYKEQANIMKHSFKNINLYQKKKNNKSKQLHHLKTNRLIYKKNKQNPNQNQKQNKKFLNHLIFPNFSV